MYLVEWLGARNAWWMGKKGARTCPLPPGDQKIEAEVRGEVMHRHWIGSRPWGGPPEVRLEECGFAEWQNYHPLVGEQILYL